VLLAAIGIYGVISYSVARRTPEIGIRMALGASGGRIRAGVVTDTMRLAIAGAALGTSLLLFVAFVAGFVPALRASRVSPITALRAD
jgi:ABC-type antimicrobial peptide transport system permease subunit